MSLVILAQLIGITATVVTLLVFIWVVITWVLPPYHPLREALDRVVEPMLAPIRRVLPMTGSIDFSPMILIILIELGSRILTSLILSMAVR
jgi:YggT family protein